MKYEKLVCDGKVAVLYSPGYGAGWSTWAASEHAEALVFDKEIVNHLLLGMREEAEEVVSRKYPEVYTGGFEDVVVAWVDEGAAFRIQEYDGSESIEIIGQIDHYIA